MKILLTGADGQLARCFKDGYAHKYEIVALNSTVLDITNLSQVNTVVDEHCPDIVINTAAYTSVDKAEEDQEHAFLVNAEGAKNIAIVCAKLNVDLIHISTDYVFDGSKEKPYTITDHPNPINVYGKTKLAGELLVLAHHPTARILRTSWVYSEYGHNFLKTMLRLADKGVEQLDIVADQYGCPTYAGNLSYAIDCLINNKSSQRLFHYTDGESMSWYTFAKQIFAARKEMGNANPAPTVNAIETSQYPTPARRPRYSVLESSFSIANKVELAVIVARL